ncbi:hypothetical protein ACLMJK_000158 [Lecanora helva]
MPDLDDPSNTYLSPKRKRDDEDPYLSEAPSPLRLRTTNLPIRELIEEEITNKGSPRTTVAGHLQGLDLEAKNDIPQLDFNHSIKPQTCKSELIASTFSPNILLPNQTEKEPFTPPPSSHGPSPTTFTANSGNNLPNLPLEIPETPRLRPVTSPSPPPSVTRSKPPKSPPTVFPAQALWWSDTEITGHDPKDPTDDGYGINGIGFLPTPAIANARVERRKKQVAEWKAREAREARQKRSDRRRRRDLDIGPTGNPFIMHQENRSNGDGARKVRFLEV